MSNKVFYSADYVNDNVTGLFDRIINIKFIRKDRSFFTIRSDYEPVWDGDSLYFKSCQPKPEIRVQYNQYQGTMINVDIFVTNLNIIENSGGKAKNLMSGKQMLSAQSKSGTKTNQPNDLLTVYGNPVVSAEIEMGYRGQFHNWANENINALNQEEMYRAFLELKLPSKYNTQSQTQKQIAESQLMFRALRKCTVVVEWAVNNNNPPDRITQFHGYVGSTEAGFQPVSIFSMDNAAEIEGMGLLTKEDLYNNLNDPFTPIEKVPVETFSLETKEQVQSKDTGKTTGKNTSKKKISTPAVVLVPKTSAVYRNFFNGGYGFTLLEAYCFHAVTRRFVKTGIEMKRNYSLEKAALSYALATEYQTSEHPLRTKRDKIAEQIYQVESDFNSEYFTFENNVIKYSSLAPADYQKKIEALIDDLTIQNYIGPRFTIKNLPEYRKLYKAIRNTLDSSYSKGEYLSWWAAAENTDNSALKSAAQITNSEKLNSESFPSVAEFILKTEKGEAKDKLYYFPTKDQPDWIVPLQNISSSTPFKNKNQKDIYFFPPTKYTSAGFVSSDKSVSQTMRCFSGLFEVRDAYMFGVPVLCSKKASELFEKVLAGRTQIEIKFLADSAYQIKWIAETFGLLYYRKHDGGFYLYTEAEKGRDTAVQPFVTEQSGTPFKIPAVYDITISPLRKIRMPFVAFLDPMTLVEWNSRSSIGEMITFYYQPDKGRNFFMVIKNTIDFSTVGDYNTMELELNDTQWTDKAEVPKSLITQEDEKIFVDVLIIPDEQMNSWQKIYESPICTIPFNLKGLWPSDETTPIEEKLSPEDKVSPLQFFSLMQVWNTKLFALAKEAEGGWEWVNSLFRVDKKANKLFRPAQADKKINFPDIEHCFSLVEDETEKRIFLKFPLMPDAANYGTVVKERDSNYILVYYQGAWEMRLKENVKATYKIEAV